MHPFLTKLAARFINFYPPFLGSGVRVRYLSSDFSIVQVKMKLTIWNRNIAGVHFGGSLYAMCDPFFMMILMIRLGPDYIVWDKSASIRFRRPGKGTVTARFSVSDELVLDIKTKADTLDKFEPVFVVKVLDHAGEVVAEVTKVLSVRRKRLRQPVVSGTISASQAKT